MQDTERDELRRLATWLSRRRAVDEAVAVLTAYGPAAVEQVASHLDALEQLLAAEHEAFCAVAAAAAAVPQSPLPPSLQVQSQQARVPASLGLDAYPDATVHSLVQARARQQR